MDKRFGYSKEEFIELFDVSYEILNYNQVAAIVTLIEKFVIASSEGEILTVAFKFHLDHTHAKGEKE